MPIALLNKLDASRPSRFAAKILTVIVAGALLYGCTNQRRMDWYDLQYMEPDCANKNAQLKFLQNQLAHLGGGGVTEVPMNFLRSIAGGVNEQKIDGRAISELRYEGRLKELIWELRSSCD